MADRDNTEKSENRKNVQVSLRERNREARRRWRSKPENRIKEKQRRRRDKEYEALRRRRSDPLRWGAVVIANIRHRAKSKNIECTLEPHHLVVPDVCPVFGVPFAMSGTGLASPLSPSVDRIDNSKGYTPDNVRVISNRANLLKKDASLEELRALVKYMETCHDHNSI